MKILGYEVHPAADVFELLPDAELALLADDIKAHGQNEKITLLGEILLDGRNRLLACKRAGVEPCFEQWHHRTEDPEKEAVDWIVSQNVRRRHLNEAQQAMAAADLEPIYAKAAKARQVAAGGDRRSVGARGPQAVNDKSRGPRGRDEAAKAVGGTSGRSVQRAKKIKQKAHPKIKRKVKQGKLSLRAAAKLASMPGAIQERVADKMEKDGVNDKAALRQVREEERAAVPADLPRASERFELIGVDFRIASVQTESVDTIICDPPYPREYLPLFEPLGAFAARVLKPGGQLVAMLGQSYLPEVLASLSKHLTYRWTCAYLTPGGQAVQVYQRKVETFWKPLLVFVSGELPKDSPWIGDVTKSAPNDNDKRFHDWYGR